MNFESQYMKEGKKIQVTEYILSIFEQDYPEFYPLESGQTLNRDGIVVNCTSVNSHYPDMIIRTFAIAGLQVYWKC